MVSSRIKLNDVPSWKEVIRLIKAVKRKGRSRDYLLISLLAKTGVRISELLGIRKKDVDLEEGTILIKQLKKREETYRKVFIPPELIPALSRYMAYLKPEDRLFPITRRAALKVIHKWTKDVLGRRIRAHAFRHAFALRILETTKNLELVRKVLGHGDYKVLKAYLDFNPITYRDEILRAIE